MKKKIVAGIDITMARTPLPKTKYQSNISDSKKTANKSRVRQSFSQLFSEEVSSPSKSKLPFPLALRTLVYLSKIVRKKTFSLQKFLEEVFKFHICKFSPSFMQHRGYLDFYVEYLQNAGLQTLAVFYS